VFYTKASGQPSIPYIYAVEEALCYGWIDSIAKKLGADSRAQHFPPRHRGSPMSEMNKARVRRLAEAVLVSPSAMESLATILDEPYQVPVDIEAALKATSEFLSAGSMARGTRPKCAGGRLDYFVKMTRQNKRLGMVQ
jgi:uncharacterized protein YdeI (YjbR/CyaY-like superfamily)